jgi:hypothetical protein
MSLLDTASLIVTPNAYKEGKLYSVVPSDGSGDMSVVRATTATRVNSAGLVELVPYNLFTYSQTFSNADWTKNNVTLTGGQSGYDGSSNAFLLTDNSTNDVHVVRQTPIVSGQYTISVYAKANTLNFVWLRGVQSSANVRAWFNLSTGTVGTVETNGTATIESVGNGWYRCSLTIADFQSGFESYIGVSNANGTISYVGSGQSIYIQNAQSNLGLIKPYQRTETRLNIPRLDYSNGSCPSLLVEPQRTNIVTYSEQLDNSNWVKGDATISANSAIAPNGTNTADKFIANSNNAAHFFYQPVPTGSCSFSIYAKAAEETVFSMWLNDFSKNAVFDLSAGTVVLSNVSSANITDVGNGWYRCEAYDTTSTSFVGVFGRNAAAYIGNGVNGMFFWGAQAEAASYTTSYIPTTSAAVTRNADAISKTGISSLIGQTQGTLFIDIVFKNPLTSINRFMSITEAGWQADGSIRIEMNTSELTVDIVNNGSSIGAITYLGTFTPNTRYKIAVAYKQNDCQMYFNGINAGSDTSTGVMPTCFQLYLNALGGGFNAPYEASNINSAALWKTRLTNAQLAQLTTI